MKPILVNADSLKAMKEMPEDYVDLIVTDPPYGYSFMGKDWDKAVVAVDYWKECLRILKPGAFAFIMSAPRQDVLSQMLVRLEHAGFETGFTSIYWAYASGFPKASNIGKKIDKRNGVQGEVIGHGKAGAGMNKVKGFGVNTTKGGEPTTEWEVREVVSDMDGSYAGFQPKPAVEVIIVVMKPLTEKTYLDQALKNGKGITWMDDCRMPFDKADTPTGGYGDMDVGMGKPAEHQEYRKTTKRQPRADGTVFKPSGFKSENDTNAEANPKGRFPANLLVSDDVLNDGKNHVGCSGQIHKTEFNPYGGNSLNKSATTRQGKLEGYDVNGSFSRFFDLDKWAEENKVVEDYNTFPFLICPKAPKSEKNAGLSNQPHTRCANISGWRDGNRKCLKCGHWAGSGTPCTCAEPEWDRPLTTVNNSNFHPTVKPVKLMSYLITLGSRKGDIVCDLFMGSGTTGVAAVKLERNFIGIEIEKDYMNLAKARIGAVSGTDTGKC